MDIARRGLLTAAGGLALPAAASSGLVASRPAAAQGADAWPERPVRLIVAWPPGGSTDATARVIQSRLGEILGKPVVIENRGGASGSIGSTEAARAAPDGYTWTLVYDNEATNQSVMRLSYRALEAFVPVTLVATGPLVMTAHRSTPWQNFAELVAAAKRAPDTLSYATSGVGGLAHVSTTLLQTRGDFRLVHVPYRGGGPAAQDAVAGHVPLYVGNVVAVKQFIADGTLRPLGVTTAGETRHVPGAKPFSQQGFEGFDAPTWWVLLGRTGTPEPILRKMRQAVSQVLAEAGVRSRIEEQGADVVASSPEEARAFLAREIERWGEVIRANNIRADG